MEKDSPLGKRPVNHGVNSTMDEDALDRSGQWCQLGTADGTSCIVSCVVNLWLYLSSKENVESKLGSVAVLETQARHFLKLIDCAQA
jgi:hypothetical protein